MSFSSPHFRFASQLEATKDGIRTRRSSVQSASRVPVKGKISADSTETRSMGHEADPFAAHYNASASFTSYESAFPPRSPEKRTRGSLLIAASDALSFKFGRRRKSIREPPNMSHLVLPEVIEISAPRRDEEVEERERLRDAAAQSIGLGPEMLQESQPPSQSAHEDDEDEDLGYSTRPLDYIPPRSLQESSFSLASIPPSSIHGRHRAGSFARSTHSRSNSRSMTPTPVPAFPATPSALAPFTQLSSTLPKYYPPSSLRIFALSKHWKSRFMVLSSPVANTSRSSGPTVSYLHLFKSSSSEDKELERLEINEQSVVFVAEEEVGGRKGVVKVGGIDVGAMRKDLNHEEACQTLWFLQILDATEAQKWIAAIKSLVLSQRSMRAGLGVPASMGGIEPRGDMDVMLTMRAQGFASSPPKPKFTLPDFNSPPPTQTSAPEQSISPESPIRSPRPFTAVSTIKGLFTSSTRPRSPSRSMEQDKDTTEDSFGTMGSSLLNMLRTNGTADASTSTPPASPKASAASATSPISRLSISAMSHSSVPEQRLDRKIIQDGQSSFWSPQSRTVNEPPARTLLFGSLQPPPRKRPSTAQGPVSNNEHSRRFYVLNQGNSSVADSFGLGSSPDIHGPIRTVARHSLGLPEQGQDSSGNSSSYENGNGIERSNSKTKRWSRQGTLLPKRLTPPSGPPPSIPSQPQSPSPHPTPRGSPHPYAAADQSRSRSSSLLSGTSPKSAVNGLPSFSKRASGSSAFSFNSVSSTHSRTNGTSPNGSPASRSGSSHRTSMPPPPRPAPTFAPPPVPAQELEPAPIVHTSSLRESVAHRALRLSLIAPKPPPSTVLPPRPDEPAFKSHRRSSSSNSNVLPPNLYPIPGSPISPASSLPPNVTLPSPSSSSALASRHTSLKQRLRILSSPSSVSTAPFSTTPTASQSTLRTSSPYPSTVEAHSPPGTPTIGEPITTMQNDPNFLQLYTPSTPTIPITIPPTRLTHNPSVELLNGSPERTSLSPPPRRASKQIAVERDTTAEDPKPSGTEISLRGSVVSLGFVSV